MSVNKYNKALGLSFAVLGVVALSTSVAANAQDTTNTNLTIESGALSISSPTDTTLELKAGNGMGATCSGTVTLTSSNIDVCGKIPDIQVEDLTGSFDGWDITADYSNLVDTGDSSFVVLLANGTDGADTKLLTIDNDTDFVTTTGLDITTGALVIAPDISASALSNLTDANGKISGVTLASVPTDEGAGTYTFDSQLSIVLPQFGDYEVAYPAAAGVAGKRIAGNGDASASGTYQGTITFTVS